jgi:hypothetical protein
MIPTNVTIAFPKEMYILVPQGETTLNISGFFMATTHGYCTEGG